MIAFVVVAAAAALAGRNVARSIGGVVDTIGDVIDASGAFRSVIMVFDIQIEITTTDDWRCVKRGKEALREFVSLEDWSEGDQLRLAQLLVYGLAYASSRGTDVLEGLRSGALVLPEEDITMLRRRWHSRRDLAPTLIALGQLVARRATNKTF